MRVTVRVIVALVLAVGMTASPRLFAQDKGEPAPPRRILQIGDFVYRLGPGLEAGPFRFHPYAAQYLVYDDNVYLTDPEDGFEQRRDISSETTLGGRLDYPSGRHLFSADYNVQVVEYFVHNTQDLLRHRARLLGFLDFDKTYVNVDNTFRNTDDPVLPDLGRFRRAENFFHLDVGHRLDRTVLEAGIHDKIYDFFDEETNYLDHNEFSFHLRGLYDFSPKTRGYGRYDYGMAGFSHQGATVGFTLNDYNYHRLSVGGYHTPEPKLSLHGWLGVMVQSVDEGSGSSDDDKEYIGPEVAVGVAYQTSEKTRLGGSFRRQMQFSGSGNFQVVDRLDGRLDWEATEKVLLSPLLFLERSDPSVTDPFLRYGAGVILDYDVLGYLHTGLQYQYRQRVAKEVGDYANHRVLGNVTIYF